MGIHDTWTRPIQSSGLHLSVGEVFFFCCFDYGE